MRIHSPQITGSAENTNIVTTTRITSLSALSASFASTASYWSGSIVNAATASYADNFTVGGTLTAQTINVQIITSSIEFNTGSTRNGSLAANTHEFTGSVLMSGSLNVGGNLNWGTTTASPYMRTIGGTQIFASSVTGSNYLYSGGTDFRLNNQADTLSLLTITNAGNVGIGTSSPGAILDVQGQDIYLNATSKVVLANAFSGVNSNSPELAFYGQSFNAGYSGGGVYGPSIQGVNQTSFGRKDLIFYQHDAGDYSTRTEAMRLTYNKDLLINHPTNIGEGKLRVSQDGSLWCTEIRHTFSTQYFLYFKYNSAGVGSVTGNGSNVSYNTSSDIRLKENIKPIENAISKIAKLKPVTYNWKSTGISDDGFIAQDLLELDEFKHRVNTIGKGEDGDELYGVDYMRFSAVLTAAIQELKSENDTLKEILQRNNIQ